MAITPFLVNARAITSFAWAVWPMKWYIFNETIFFHASHINQKFFLQTCPGNSIFDPILLVCVTPETASCTTTTAISSTTYEPTDPTHITPPTYPSTEPSTPPTYPSTEPPTPPTYPSTEPPTTETTPTSTTEPPSTETPTTLPTEPPTTFPSTQTTGTPGTGPTSAPFVCPEPDGDFANPDDCGSFYQCSNGYPILSVRRPRRHRYGTENERQLTWDWLFLSYSHPVLPTSAGLQPSIRPVRLLLQRPRLPTQHGSAHIGNIDSENLMKYSELMCIVRFRSAQWYETSMTWWVETLDLPCWSKNTCNFKRSTVRTVSWAPSHEFIHVKVGEKLCVKLELALRRYLGYQDLKLIYIGYKGS